ncbi:cytochrome P450 [Daedalea quercina L-15889]|uniref:Cytochrome P450 n=1 Tax=Daedalea quercina L-15889 TaxID=1314783 RepID=A0A165QS21_9APHY|nr:cytochrome P450 [Daedalea quercina L-15889]
MMSTLAVAIDFLAILLGLSVLNYVLTSRRQGRSPPGPPGWPIIGNILDMPASHEWYTFAQWGEKWGDIVSANLLGKHLVILNSSNVADEMLDKKSAIYSDRPVFPVAGEVIGWERILGFHQYGPRWREIRRLFSRTIGAHNSLTPLMDDLERNAREFLRRVASDPATLTQQVHRFTGASTLKMTYEYTVAEENDELLEIVDTAIGQFCLASAPGAYLADVFPIPGWKRTAQAQRKDLDKMCDIPYDFTKAQVVAFRHVYMSLNLEGYIGLEREAVLKDAASSMYAAALRSALCWEVLRWQPVSPLSVPHSLTQDDVHDGYFLPKGTLVIANIWKMLRDPRCYTRPDQFNPDRFLPKAGAEPEYDPRQIGFGFGRRLKGLRLAEMSLFLICAASLAALDISKPVVNGEVIEPSMKYTTGTISHPCEFKCTIKPRSPSAEALLSLS